jgi:hypothetical protein
VTPKQVLNTLVDIQSQLRVIAEVVQTIPSGQGWRPKVLREASDVFVLTKRIIERAQ